ncbi:RNA-dependent ATPase rok1 [Blastocladiella emersonii ATCC 22665]|nr:RNA-dependent ATPase rok1 [Blastocladiella emersonii ATCC 22665]
MDIFRVLTGGAKFDTKRFQGDVDLFQAKPVATKAVKADESSLDFFGASAKKPEPKAGGKKQKKQAAKAQAGSDDEAEVDESSPAAAAADDADEEPPAEPFADEEAMHAFRRANRIKVDGDDAPAPVQTFGDLYHTYEVAPYLRANVRAAGYTAPTPIQMQSTPIIMHGRDVLACAPTGSGKTLAYLLPILHKLQKPAKTGARVCIIAPTRELVLQIERELRKLVSKKWRVLTLTKSSNLSIDPAQQAKTDILISTPMRLVQALQEGKIKLNTIQHLVFDEADRLLDLGFLEQADEILAACPTKRQTCMFSATLSSTIETLAKTVMRDDVLRVLIGVKNTGSSTIDQSLVYVGDESGKLMSIRQHLRTGELKPPVLIFVQSIDRAKELFRELVYDGMNVDVIHADRTQAQRDRIIEQFRLGHLWILIATDVLARGIDMVVQTVVNYDFPTSTESYIHRIGRTGRAGRRGKAITYFTKDDAGYLRSIVNVVKESGCDVPEWMLTLKKADQKTRKQLKRVAPARPTISTMSKMDLKEERRQRKLAKREMREHREAKQRAAAAEAGEGASSSAADKPKSKATKQKKQNKKKGAKTDADGDVAMAES